MREVFLPSIEDCVRTEEALVGYSVDLHLMLEPFVDVPEIWCIAVWKCAYIRTKIREDVLSPGALALEPFHSEAEGAFELFLVVSAQFVKLRDANGGR